MDMRELGRRGGRAPHRVRWYSNPDHARAAGRLGGSAPHRYVRVPLRPLLRVSELTMSQLARALGVSSSTVYRWRDVGLGRWQADRAAAGININPATIWGDEWDVA